ncbi:CHAD domain-containing protein [Streptomyces peucetius]|uniref:CHAD domain-containing protein n=1 Tax=Streptomyces peucetius TaxID=1950 RepID=A0ABY6I7N8_STRPE|nr:CHAD domain-containing protein [Streptomyces peucetius]UYQ63013.1 CHAD domain-containing protein [Streptomyces peucetius]
MHSPELPRPDTGPDGTLAGTAGEAVAHYLHAQAACFLRSLRRHGESGAETAAVAESAHALRTASRRIGGTLHTFRALLDPVWADGLRTELAWLSTTLAQEHACTSRLSRLLDALSRLSGTSPLPPARGEAFPLRGQADAAGDRTTGADTAAHRDAAGSASAGDDSRADAAGVAHHGAGGQRPRGGREDVTAADMTAAAGDPAQVTAAIRASAAAGPQGTPERSARGAGRAGAGALAVGAARAGALLERQLTLARTRAHSAALQALGSSRFHAVADAVALLASELPLGPAAAGPAGETLAQPAQAAERRLLAAVAELPLGRAAHPYNAEALFSGLAPVSASAGEAQDAPWHEVRRLLRLHRYAQEVLHPGADPVLCHAGLVLDRHRDAAEAAAAAADAARTPRIAPATAYALGVLHADQRHEVEAARFAFQQEWRHASARTTTSVTAVTAP